MTDFQARFQEFADPHYGFKVNRGDDSFSKQLRAVIDRESAFSQAVFGDKTLGKILPTGVLPEGRGETSEHFR